MLLAFEVNHLAVIRDDDFKCVNGISFSESWLVASHIISHMMLDLDDDHKTYSYDRNMDVGGVMLLVHRKLRPM